MCLSEIAICSLSVTRKRAVEEAFSPTKPEKNRKKRIPNGQRSEEGEKEEEEEEVMMASASAGITTRF